MPDIVDRAAVETDAYIAECIQRQRKPVEAPDEEFGSDGQLHRYCLDCADELAADRLAASPDAVRCVPCESAREAPR